MRDAQSTASLYQNYQTLKESLEIMKSPDSAERGFARNALMKEFEQDHNTAGFSPNRWKDKSALFQPDPRGFSPDKSSDNPFQRTEKNYSGFSGYNNRLSTREDVDTASFGSDWRNNELRTDKNWMNPLPAKKTEKRETPFQSDHFTRYKSGLSDGRTKRTENSIFTEREKTPRKRNLFEDDIY
jgi:hypothetical protein